MASGRRKGQTIPPTHVIGQQWVQLVDNTLFVHHLDEVRLRGHGGYLLHERHARHLELLEHASAHACHGCRGGNGCGRPCAYKHKGGVRTTASYYSWGAPHSAWAHLGGSNREQSERVQRKHAEIRTAAQAVTLVSVLAQH